MDYPYEQLSPEKFQLFCQALLAKENPNMQLYPIGQPDGGRDATQRYFMPPDGFIMYQVKFVRNPLAEEDSHKKLLQTVKNELETVKKRIKDGAKKFILVTNVPGTGHHDAGSIDQVDTLLKAELKTPAQCLWRNDLNRRLDTAWELKWVYPELMTGPDLIRAIIERGLSDNQEKRVNAIEAFTAHQYGLDEEVKFKQVDLQNRLLDLFIDVPISRRLPYEYTRELPFNYDADVFDEETNEETDEEEFEEAQTRLPRTAKQRFTGAADILLTRDDPALVVLEGAPGQGKSTITQYICQVHRMRLLNKALELTQVIEPHRGAAVRLPVKVDLRDFATWTTRRNPFTAESEMIKEENWAKSLEAFIAALIRNQSGGVDFSVADLHAVFRVSAVLLVLDGLDEVADIGRRTDVVAEITKGVERLRSLAASLKVVVTSRPTAFANSPGLPEKLFLYLSLESVTQDLIDEYANKWIKARRLKPHEAAEVKRALREKLSQPHMRDLARNPMQLAILLSLIHTHGTSLPDQRTALYDSYVNLFFNREAKKSEVVRNNRRLLIDIHRYLAWLLHTRAEEAADDPTVRSHGSIEERQLKEELVKYLKSEGHEEPSLPEKLFSGVVERVVALVSRVEGTYEFEVQPLREYFAARYLYDTAPYSPVGRPRPGTKPERFDALARDFYWLNVTRFYAGCYSKGELESLIDRMGELCKDPKFRLLSHPRVLAATLLSDYVFSQHPKSMGEVIKLMLDGVGLRFLLTSNSRRLSHSQRLALPTSCGRAELVSKCFSMLRGPLPADLALDVIDLINANSPKGEVYAEWRPDLESRRKEDRTAWLQHGLNLGCVASIPKLEFCNILSDKEMDPERVELLLRGRRADVLEARPEFYNCAIDCLLSRKVMVSPNWRQLRTTDVFAQALDAAKYASAYRHSSPQPLREVWRRFGEQPRPRAISESAGSGFSPPVQCSDFISIANKLTSSEARIWATQLGPWNDLVGALESIFGETWAAVHLANVASGIRSHAETCGESQDLFDSKSPLCRRARYARLRAGHAGWWRETLRNARAIKEQLLALILWFTWAGPQTMASLIEITEPIVVSLSEAEWQLLFDLVENSIELTVPPQGDRLVDLPEKLPASISPRTLSLLRMRCKNGASNNIFHAGLGQYGGRDKRILKVSQRHTLENLIFNGTPDWDTALKIFENAYACGVVSARYSSMSLAQRLTTEIPLDKAIIVSENANRYPTFMVAAAEGCCRQNVASQIIPVAKIAKEGKWFLH